jgi:Tfp pilus assembly protein PilO
MSGRIDFGQLSRGRQIAVVCAGLLVIAIAGYMLLISPKRGEAHDLSAQTAAVQAQIEQKRSSPSAYAQVLPAVKAAAFFQLTKAMPKDINMADVILELNSTAVDSGISFDEIDPQQLVMGTTYNVQPIKLSFTGNYYNMLDFLFRVRNLVGVSGNTADTTFQSRSTLGVHGGKLFTTGRMYAVSEVKFAQGQQSFPIVTVTLTLDTYELAAAPPGAAAATTGALALSQPATTGTPAPTTTTGSK